MSQTLTIFRKILKTYIIFLKILNNAKSLIYVPFDILLVLFIKTTTPSVRKILSKFVSAQVLRYVKKR